MLFNSSGYILLFLPIVVIGFYRLSRLGQGGAGKAWLVAASLFFYGYWNPAYLLLLLLSILVNYALVRILCGKRLQAASKSWRLAALVSGVLFNLGFLGYYKYASFFVETINESFGTHFPSLQLLLPLAISFFTFQQIACLVDSYQGKGGMQHLRDYFLFVTFFPQLIAGPIVHHGEMMPQFQSEKSRLVNWRNICVGAFVFAMGLFKKVVIADGFAVTADIGFTTEETLGILEAWGACLSYTMQIYFDFSGYTDMAVGAALMLNIHLPINFNSPYKALSIQDFWRRWHMTLSRWLRDYLYIPLGGNQRGTLRTCLNIMLTFVLGGLWHGGGWTFLIWGAMHGVALAIHRAWAVGGICLPKPIAWLLTFVFVSVTWVFFRADSLDSAVRMTMSMFDVSSLTLSQNFVDQVSVFLPTLSDWISPIVAPRVHISEWSLLAAFVGIGMAIFLRNSMEYKDHYLKEGRAVHVAEFIFFAVVASSGITFMLASSSKVFLYFNF